MLRTRMANAVIAACSIFAGAVLPCVAAGPVMRPSATPSTSAPSGVPNTGTSIKPPATQAPFQTETQQTPTSTTSPTPTTAPAPSGVTQQPAAGADASQTQAPGAQQAGQPGTVSATINYDEGGPSVPSSSEVSILQSLNEALVKGPRAAALRAQLAIAKSGLSAATVSPNPIFFMDRGLVAEAVRRVGPTFTIDPPWKLAFRMLAASRLYAQTRIDLMTQLWSLRADVRRAYTEAVIAIEAQRTLTELYELTERLLEVSEKRFQAGDVPELDVLRARLATSQADVDRNVGRQRVVRARQQLNIIMGRAVEGRIEVPRLPDFLTQNQILSGRSTKHGILPDFSQPVPPLQYFLDIAEKNRYELRSLDQQVKVNKANLYNAMGAAVPDPIVTTGQSQAGNPPFGPKVTAQFFTLNIEMPMTNTNQGDITKFQATGRQLRYQIQAQRNQVIADVSSAYNNLLAARERIRVYQEHVLRDSNEVARLSRRSYEVGQSDINSTLLAQQANVGIRQAYLDAVTNYQGAYTDLEQACGRPLE